MDVDFVGGVDLQEVLDGMDGYDEFVEWEAGIILKAEVMNFSIFPMLQEFFFSLFLILIFSNIPDLKIAICNMLSKFFEMLLFWVGYMIEMWYNFYNVEWFIEVVSDFAIVIGNSFDYLILF